MEGAAAKRSRAGPRKVAVLGTGMAALTSVYWATGGEDPKANWKKDNNIESITMYQLGYRNGGKATSGRNVDYYDRIEEHGPHVLLGWYSNILRLMKNVYEQLGRVPGEDPFATFDECFHEMNSSVFWQPVGDDGEVLDIRQAVSKFIPWVLDWPPMNETPKGWTPPPGGPSDFINGACDDSRSVLGINPDPMIWIGLMMGWLKEFIREEIAQVELALAEAHAAAANQDAMDTSEGQKDDPEHLEKLHKVLKSMHGSSTSTSTKGTSALRTEEEVGGDAQGDSGSLDAILAFVRDVMEGDNKGASQQSLGLLAALLTKMVDDFGKATAALKAVMGATKLVMSRIKSTMLTLIAFSRAIIRHYELLYGTYGTFTALDKWDFKQLIAAELPPGPDRELVMNCPFVQYPYFLMFGYDRTSGAGSTLLGTLRAMFGYGQHLMYHFKAGMGDIAIVPMIELLKRRGVEFKYFARVEDIIPSADGSHIEKVKIMNQLGQPATGYDPCIKIRQRKPDSDEWYQDGKKCFDVFPVAPLWEQIGGADKWVNPATGKHYDFEAYDPIGVKLPNGEWDPNYPHETEQILEYGKDFDVVLAGMAVSAYHYCAKSLLTKANGEQTPFGRMIEAGAWPVAWPTECAQMWFNKDWYEMGWQYPPNPKDRTANSTQVITTEYGPFVDVPLDTTKKAQGSSAKGPFTDMSGSLYDGISDFTGVVDSENWPLQIKPKTCLYLAAAANDQLPGLKMLDFFVKKGAFNSMFPTLSPTPYNINNDGSDVEWKFMSSKLGVEGLDAKLANQHIAHMPNVSDYWSMAPAGQFRLTNDETGWPNLIITGDWTDNKIMNLGSVETTTMSGCRAGRAVINATSGVKKHLNTYVYGAFFIWPCDTKQNTAVPTIEGQEEHDDQAGDA